MRLESVLVTLGGYFSIFTKITDLSFFLLKRKNIQEPRTMIELKELYQ